MPTYVELNLENIRCRVRADDISIFLHIRSGTHISRMYTPWEGLLEDLTVLKRSSDLLNNVKIGQDQLGLIMNHILIYGGCSILVK